MLPRSLSPGPPVRPGRPYNGTLRRTSGQAGQRAAGSWPSPGSELLHRTSVRDWKKLTVRAVADRAGVNERTVYRYFGSERGLRDAVHRIAATQVRAPAYPTSAAIANSSDRHGLATQIIDAGLLGTPRAAIVRRSIRPVAAAQRRQTTLVLSAANARRDAGRSRCDEKRDGSRPAVVRRALDASPAYSDWSSTGRSITSGPHNELGQSTLDVPTRPVVPSDQGSRP